MPPRTVTVVDAAGNEHVVELRADAVVAGGRALAVQPLGGGMIRIGDDPGAAGWTAAAGDARWVFLDGQVHVFTIPSARRAGGRRSRGGAHHGSLAAPMPATVRQVQVAPGDRVTRGDVLIVLEAMKMELPVRATADGRVEAVHCAVGDMVQPGQELIAIEEA
jgi:biotin carboxyl carrier protein